MFYLTFSPFLFLSENLHYTVLNLAVLCTYIHKVSCIMSDVQRTKIKTLQ